MGHIATAGVVLHRDGTATQFLADLVILVIILVNALAGVRSGLVRRALALAGVFGGCAVATYLGNSLVHVVYGANGLYADAAVFIGLFVLVIAGVEMLGALYGRQLAQSAALAFNRVTGFLAGLIVGIGEVAVIVLVILAVGAARPLPGHDVPATHTQLSNEIRGSSVGGLVAQAQPGLDSLFAPVLPADLAEHLSRR